PWTIAGFGKDNGSYCAAERALPGAAGGGATLQYALLRSRLGYFLGLGSEDWDLRGNTGFPVELNAETVLRSDANAKVFGKTAVVIELGSDQQLMQRLATAPTIEVKTARTTFKLPVDALDQAVTEIDACFGTIKQSANPFAVPGPGAKQSVTPPGTPGPNTSSADSRSTPPDASSTGASL